MGNQQDLFDRYTEPLARTDDPITSHAAAEAIVVEGKLGRMQLVVLQLIQANHGLTGSELDEASPGRKGQAHKRTKELERMGYIYVGGIRTCNVSGRQAQTYYPTLKGSKVRP